MNQIAMALTADALATSLCTGRFADRGVARALNSELLGGSATIDLAIRNVRQHSPNWQSIGDEAIAMKTRGQSLTPIQHSGMKGTPIGLCMGVAPTGHTVEVLLTEPQTFENNQIAAIKCAKDWHWKLQQQESK